MELKDLLENLNHSLTLYIVFPMIIGLGLYLTLKLRFIQINQLKTSFACLTKKNAGSEGNISRFEAISTVLAGNFGTGNVSGMAVAIATGGPGALVWMWVMAFFGAAIQYASCFLGAAYRQKNANGEYVGGPMYYLRNGLNMNYMGVLFALFTVFGAVTVGNFAQINSIVLPLEKLGANPLLCGIGLAVFVGMVILGGIKRIANIAAYIVPFKAFLYLGTAFLIIAMHYDQVLSAFSLMFQYAFDFNSVMGGVAGVGVLKAMTTGFGRGLFATDAGTGIVPILQASARSNSPVMDGISTLLAPFLVMIVCTTTGLVLIMTGAWQEPGLQSTNMVTHAFTQGLGSSIGGYIVIVSLMLFAYTTILAWYYCGQKAVEFLVGTKNARFFTFFYLALVPMGSIVQVSTIWILADIAITLMVISNLIGVMGLTNKVIQATENADTSLELERA
jgi:alanine or glycine:cation symporter, AGCS family